MSYGTFSLKSTQIQLFLLERDLFKEGQSPKTLTFPITSLLVNGSTSYWNKTSPLNKTFPLIYTLYDINPWITLTWNVQLSKILNIAHYKTDVVHICTQQIFVRDLQNDMFIYLDPLMILDLRSKYQKNFFWRTYDLRPSSPQFKGQGTTSGTLWQFLFLLCLHLAFCLLKFTFLWN